MTQQRWVYYFADGETRRGPFPLEELRGFPLQPETLLWREGLPEWTAMRNVPELWAIFAERLAPPVAIDPQSPLAAPLDYAAPTGLAPSGMSIASLVLGISGLIWWCLPGSALLGVPMSVLAVVFAIMARRQVRRKEAGGAGQALAGLVLGVTNLSLLAGILAIAGFFMFAAYNARPAAAPATPPPASMPVE